MTRTPERSGLDALQRLLAMQRRWATLAGLPMLATMYGDMRIRVLDLDLALALKAGR